VLVILVKTGIHGVLHFKMDSGLRRGDELALCYAAMT
jgi:hypothetical protein